VHDLRPLAPDEVAQLGVDVAIPKSPPCDLQATHVVDRVVGANKVNDLMTTLFQHAGLVLEDSIFPARQLVVVVAQKDLHRFFIF